MPDTLATIRARTPKLKGESEFAYQQRLGLALKQAQAKTSLPNPFDAAAPRRDHEPGWNYNARQALGPVANAVFGEQPFNERVSEGVGSIFNRFTSAAANVPSMQDIAVAGTQLVNGLFETGAEAKQRVAAQAATAPKPASAVAPAPAPGTAQTLNPFEDMVAQARGMGGTITSVRRSPAKNAAVGGTANSYHLTGQAFDSVPPKGMSMGQWHATLKQRFPGMDVINEGDHVHVEPASRGQAAQLAGAGGNNPLGLVNPFDPSYGNAALSEIDRATALASQPFSITQDMPEAPAVPEPILAPKTDFTAINEATERLRPQMDDEKKQLKMRRSAYFAGIGQALMSIPEGAGLGKVLGMLGGGAMLGAAKGDAEVQARMDAYDEKMARFNVLLLNNQKEQAATVRQEAQHEAQTLNAYGLKKWEVAYDQYAKLNQTTVQGDAVITSRFDPKTNKLVTKRIPIASAVQAAGAMQRAQVFQQMGGQQNAANAQIAGVTNGLIAAQAAQVYSQGAEGGEDALVAVPAFVATEAYAALPSVLGEENWTEFTKEAQTVLAQQNISPGPEYNEMMKQYIVTKVTQLAAINPTFRKELMGLGGIAQQNRAVRADRTRTTKSGPKGTTTTTREEY